jgi:paraquat-inducible protein A
MKSRWVPVPSESSSLHGQHLQSCHDCCTVQPASNVRCSFCEHRLHARKHHSLQRSWIFLVTALILYLPANLLPIMTTSQMGKETVGTIAGGVVLLWEQGSYMIAVIILVASLIVPIAKFIALFALFLSKQLGIYRDPQNRIIIYRAIEFVGRWSMVDVFVVAFLASLIQMGNLMSVYPGPAALAFAGMVFFSMLAANSIDPKLFWDDDE